jgi:hypothetical protein
LPLVPACVGAETDFPADFEHCDEGDEVEGPDGEGCLDSALFSAHSADTNFGDLQQTFLEAISGNAKASDQLQITRGSVARLDDEWSC